MTHPKTDMRDTSGERIVNARASMQYGLVAVRFGSELGQAPLFAAVNR